MKGFICLLACLHAYFSTTGGGGVYDSSLAFVPVFLIGLKMLND